MTMPILMAIADDHPMLLKGMQAMFESDPRYRIVATGRTADEALALAIAQQPVVLIIDLSMPGDVFLTIDTIARQHAGTRIIVFTAYANTELALRAFDAGARAFVLKGRPTDDLHEAIAAVLEERAFVSPGFSERLVAALQTRARGETLKPIRLSPRERELVRGLLAGKTNRDIAEALGLTEKTVKHYMTNLMSKLKVKNRLEAVRAARAQLLDQDADGIGAPDSLPPREA